MVVEKELFSSNKSIRAIVRIERKEIADIEKMVILVDPSYKNFGTSVRLIQIGDDKQLEYYPDNNYRKEEGLKVEPQFGFDLKNCINFVRYYEVSVYRD